MSAVLPWSTAVPPANTDGRLAASVASAVGACPGAAPAGAAATAPVSVASSSTSAPASRPGRHLARAGWVTGVVGSGAVIGGGSYYGPRAQPVNQPATSATRCVPDWL